MKYQITEEDYQNIVSLADCAVSASSKRDAKPFIDQLDFIANSGGYAGSAGNILSELCGYVKSASGNVSDKERYADFVKTALFKLRSFVDKEDGVL